MREAENSDQRMFKPMTASVTVICLTNAETTEGASYSEGVPFCHHQFTEVCPIPIAMD